MIISLWWHVGSKIVSLIQVCSILVVLIMRLGSWIKGFQISTLRRSFTQLNLQLIVILINISNLCCFSETYGHSLSGTTQLSLIVDMAIRIVWHSAEVAHFTHKIREAFVSSTIPRYLKYSGEAPDHYLSLAVTKKEPTQLVVAPVPNIVTK